MNYQKTYLIDKPMEDVYSIFSDLKKFGELHPLITSVEKIDKEGCFKVKEKPYTYFPIKISYLVKSVITNDSVIYTIKGLPFLKPTLTYHFNVKNDSTELHFGLVIKGLFMAKSYLAYKMTKALDKLVININKSI